MYNTKKFTHWITGGLLVLAGSAAQADVLVENFRPGGVNRRHRPQRRAAVHAVPAVQGRLPRQ